MLLAQRQRLGRYEVVGRVYLYSHFGTHGSVDVFVDRTSQREHDPTHNGDPVQLKKNNSHQLQFLLHRQYSFRLHDITRLSRGRPILGHLYRALAS